MSLPHASSPQSARIEIEVELDGNLIDAAEALGLDISQACEAGLLAEVEKVRLIKYRRDSANL